MDMIVKKETKSKHGGWEELWIVSKLYIELVPWVFCFAALQEEDELASGMLSAPVSHCLAAKWLMEPLNIGRIWFHLGDLILKEAVFSYLCSPGKTCQPIKDCILQSWYAGAQYSFSIF